VEQVRASAVGVILSGSLEQPAPARSVGIVGSAKSNYRTAQHSHRAGSRETTGGAAARFVSSSAPIDADAKAVATVAGESGQPLPLCRLVCHSRKKKRQLGLPCGKQAAALRKALLDRWARTMQWWRSRGIIAPASPTGLEQAIGGRCNNDAASWLSEASRYKGGS
jgi:hypothetical protein